MNEALDRVITGLRGVTTASVADAVDAVVGRRGYMTSEIKPVVPIKIVGPAATVLEGEGTQAAPPIHAMETLDAAAPGSVVVIGLVNPPGSKDVAVWGGLMTAAAATRGLAGAVLDAAARDLDESREAGFPLYARAVVPSTTVGRYVTLDRDLPVSCGGVLVRPGDIVVGDNDGVVIVPAEAAEDVLRRAEEIEETERAMVEAIKRHGAILPALKEYGRI